MPTTVERQSAADMLKDLLPGKVRIGVGLYDRARGRTYRAVTEGDMVIYLEDVSPAQLRRLWRRVQAVITDEQTWRE
ncbi:MAG: hypothetical protein ACRD3G_12150 [Vicinamibacterales bacterium]